MSLFDGKFTNQCPWEDDNGVQCTNIMTEHEAEQDGMCLRCAEMVWDSLKNDTKVDYSSEESDYLQCLRKNTK